MTDLDDMEAKARAATAGPWSTEADLPYAHKPRVYGGDLLVAEVGNCEVEKQAEWEANAAHIAACNPAAILALIAEHRALLARVEELEAALRPFAREEGTWAWSVSSKYHPGILEPNQRIAHAKAEFSVGDLRRAARVLADRSGEKGDG